MKVQSCYTTRGNAEVILWHAVVVVPVSNQIHSPCIHKYCNFRSWWTAEAWNLMYRLKSDQALKKLVTMALCYVKIWMTVDELSTYKED